VVGGSDLSGNGANGGSGYNAGGCYNATWTGPGPATPGTKCVARADRSSLAEPLPRGTAAPGRPGAVLSHANACKAVPGARPATIRG
jgi:hypothetical protein